MNINALKRDDRGKSASRRLRHNGRIPAIVYGGNKVANAITINTHEITNLLENEDAYTSVLDLIINKNKELVIIKQLQRHPAKNNITHIDFQRINLKKSIITRIPIHFIDIEKNAAVHAGSLFNQFTSMVEVACLPSDLPHSVDVNVSELNIGEHLSLTDIVMPKGVALTALQHENVEAHNQTIASVTVAKKQIEEVDVDADALEDEGEVKDEGETKDN